VNTLDYYNNPKIVSQIKKQILSIKNAQDKEDCRQEIFAELYDFMPLDEEETVNLIERVGRKFRRGIQCIAENETGLYEAGIL
jgi:hypothetical protein